MENFTNETLDTSNLPKFEEVKLTSLNQSYFKVILLNTFVIFLVLLIAFITVIFFKSSEFSNTFKILLATAIVVIPLIKLWISYLSFKKKAFAFREHDVIFQSGLIATHTMIIPYNRVQHVALHEGVFSRMFGLAKVEIFTAGGSSGDIEIPGILKDEAENIKQLIMGKIQKQLV